MAAPKDNRIIIAIGAAVAVVVAIVLALIFGGQKARPDEAPPAAKGGLTVDVAEAPSLEPTRELRCYVDGQYVGMATLAACAQRNGVATDALDVGLDAAGELVAAPTGSLTPAPELPPVELVEKPPVQPVEPSQPQQPQPQPVQTGAACLRHAGGEWRSAATGVSLNACVRMLYEGTCVRPGEALYGRWGETTLRLVPRRVEQSQDNSRFTTLAAQDSSCRFPGLN